MTRLSDTIITANTAYARGRQSPMVDVRKGGQHGLSYDLSTLMNNQSHIAGDLVCLLVDAPKGFSYLPNGDFYIQTLKAIVELHALEWSGFARALSVETTDTPVAGGGEVQEHFTNVTQERSNPSLRLNEKYGRAFHNFFYDYISMLMMNPHSKIAGIATLSNKPADMLLDMYSCTMAFIEHDPTHTKVVQSYLVTNMFPKGTGDNTNKKDRTAAREATELTIEWTGTTQTGPAVDEFCQGLLSSINMTNANAFLQAPFVNQIDSAVASIGSTIGYKAQAEQIGNNAIKV